MRILARIILSLFLSSICWAQPGAVFHGQNITASSSGQHTLDTDAFSGTAATALHTYNANWINSTFGTQCFDAEISTPTNGAAGAGSAGGTSCDSRTGQTWTNDQFAQATMAVIPNHAGFICVRVTALGGNFQGYCGGPIPDISSGQYFVSRFDNGARTNLTCSNSTTPTINDVINIQVQGTTIVLKVNGTTICSPTDATYSTGSPGLLIQDNAAGHQVFKTWNAGSVT